MGTSSQSIENPIERDEFDKLVKEALGRSPRRTEQLAIKFREIVNDVLFEDPALTGVRPTMRTAIKNKVRTEIADKLRTWIANGKRLSDWPFKNIEIDD